MYQFLEVIIKYFGALAHTLPEKVYLSVKKVNLHETVKKVETHNPGLERDNNINNTNQ